MTNNFKLERERLACNILTLGTCLNFVLRANTKTVDAIMETSGAAAAIQKSFGFFEL